MTELSPNCLPAQLPGVATARHGPLQGIPLASRGKRKSNTSFIVISNFKSCRKPDLCICINGFESEGFVHKSFVSQECNEHSRIHIEKKSLEYFALLKEYITSVTSIRNLISELEAFSEEQCNDEGSEEDSKYSCNVSKVLNILERFRSDMKHMKSLEVRFKSFLKSEMLFLSQTIGLTLRGLTKFILSSEHQVIQSVYMILKNEIKNLINYSVDELCRKNSSWNENCIHLSQLAGKFEKLARETTMDVEKWTKSWRDKIVVSVSKRSGIRSQYPLLYLKKLSQPHLLKYIKSWMLLMSLDDNFTNFISSRSLRVANNCIKSFYLLVFQEDKFCQPARNEVEMKDSDLLSTPNEKNEELSRSTKKSLAISLKSFRSKFFQGLWEDVCKEESIISVFIMTVLSSNFSPNWGKSANLTGDAGKCKSECTQDKSVDLGQQNGLIIPGIADKSQTISKKVHWDDMVDPDFSKEAIDSHMDSLWISLSKDFCNRLCYEYSFADLVNQKWDFSLVAMDPERASIALSCLSVKKLRSDSGESFNTYINLCLGEGGVIECVF